MVQHVAVRILGLSQGVRTKDASPVSQSDVEIPDATAVAATVNACAHLSASSIPAMHLITNPRCAMR